MDSLSRLEEGGFNVVKSLAGVSARLEALLGVTERNQGLEVIIKEWISGRHPITWGSMLGTLREIDLRGLSQEIEDYMYGEHQSVCDMMLAFKKMSSQIWMFASLLCCFHLELNNCIHCLHTRSRATYGCSFSTWDIRSSNYV